MDSAVETELALRLRHLSATLAAFEPGAQGAPLHIDGADADGDEVARLAAQVERLGNQVAQQIVRYERLGLQHRELLTNVSHDLRTPLASMQGYLELLLLRHGRLEAAEQRNYLETAARQSERLARLVDNLFQLAELETDDARPQSENFALAELVQDIVQKYAPDALRRKIQLHSTTRAFEHNPSAFAVHADLRLIDRVLAILVDNALHHTPQGGSVTIEIARDAQRARLAVRDTGVGIAAADLPGLFERYYRAERVAGANTTPHGGLGLAIARRIVQLHGGELHVGSAPGTGTTVRFDLPLAPHSNPPSPLVGRADSVDRGHASAVADPSPQRPAPLEQRCNELRAALERSEAARASAEADLRAVEQRYLLALRGSQDGLWEWDLASNSVHLSPRWKSMLGFGSNEIGDDKSAWVARVHPDDRPGFEAALQQQLRAGGDAFDHEVRLVRKDGSVCNVLSRGVAIRHENGVVYRVVGLDTDVTRIRRMQTLIDSVAAGTAGARGAAFFPALVRNFARALDVDLAFIAQCIDEPATRVRTLACWNSVSGDADNFEFDLAGTPCDEVIQGGRTCFHREDLERSFPRERGYQAYLGMPIVASDGRVLGHLAFFDRKPRGQEILGDSVFQIFLARAAAEMERIEALEQVAMLRDEHQPTR